MPSMIILELKARNLMRNWAGATRENLNNRFVGVAVSSTLALSVGSIRPNAKRPRPEMRSLPCHEDHHT